MVSIICNAYNQEAYIEQCLKGFVMQKTEFKFEVLVHDDASVDKTADIIREYERNYPDIIKPIYQKENQYTRGGVGRFQYPRAKGKYIAICEGDDFWTDAYKLQRQVDALEMHPEVDICAHAADVISEDGTRSLERISPRTEMCIIQVEDVITGDGWFVATNSLMYRHGFLNYEMNFRKVWNIDYSLQIAGSLRGGMLYLPETMSTYRYMSNGSWSSAMTKSVEKRKAALNSKREMLQELDRETKGVYHQYTEQVILISEFWFYYYDGPFKKALERKYKKIRQSERRRVTIKLWIKVLFPWLGELRRKRSVCK